MASGNTLVYFAAGKRTAPGLIRRFGEAHGLELIQVETREEVLRWVDGSIWVDPFGDGAQLGVCGADVDTIVMLLDISETYTNVAIVKSSDLLFARIIPIGFENFNTENKVDDLM